MCEMVVQKLLLRVMFMPVIHVLQKLHNYKTIVYELRAACLNMQYDETFCSHLPRHTPQPASLFQSYALECALRTLAAVVLHAAKALHPPLTADVVQLTAAVPSCFGSPEVAWYK